MEVRRNAEIHEARQSKDPSLSLRFVIFLDLDSPVPAPVPPIFMLLKYVYGLSDLYRASVRHRLLLSACTSLTYCVLLALFTYQLIIPQLSRGLLVI